MAAAFHAGVWNLLSKQVVLYTLGESTSLPEYDAHCLLAATLYVLGVDPADGDEAAMADVLEAGVEEAFACGLLRIEDETRGVTDLWRAVCLNMPLLESVALKDTLESLKDFPARYDPRFFAHEIPADIDYPLSRPVPETVQGVDYVATYLRRLLAECRFLRCFDVEDCRAVLHAVHPAYGELILNLFEPVAANAVGCALADVDVRSLHVGDAGRARIAHVLEAATPKQRRALLSHAASSACDALGLRAGGEGEAEDVEAVRALVDAVARDLAPRLGTALSGVFVR